MRAAVLGSPIAHSLSPVLHRAAYAALGLDWTYDAIEVAADGLPDFLAGLGQEWAGLSLTMPLKVAALPLLTDRSPLVDVTGAANTVVLRGGARYGHNTDVAGLLAALAEAGVTRVASAVVLGGGATACSALAALAQLGCRTPVLVTRSAPTAALATAARLGQSAVPVDAERLTASAPELVISTLPAGAADRFGALLAGAAVLVDVVYDPWPTALAQACRGLVVGGAAMLLHQAAAQVELMTGRPAPLEAMRAALPGSSPWPMWPKGQ